MRERGGGGRAEHGSGEQRKEKASQGRLENRKEIILKRLAIFRLQNNGL